MTRPNYPPAAYIRHIPDDSFVRSEGSDYHVGGGGVVTHYPNPGVSLRRGVEGVIANLQFGDPFPMAAVAELPNGLSYVKAGNVWLLAPIPSSLPVVLTKQVHGYEDCWVIKQTPYAGSKPVENPSVIQFNVPVLLAKDGGFSEANEPVTFAHTTGRKATGKISIAVDVPLMAPWSGSMQSSSQVNATVTKGHLAKGVVREVEKALGTSNKVLLAFFNGMFIKEVSLEDLFLVDLVQRSKGTFQPTIALRVPPAHKV